MFLLEGLGLLDGLVEGADVGEGFLGEVVALAFQDGLEGGNGVLEMDELAFPSGELAGDKEGLGEEVSDPSCPVDGELVLLGELVDAKNCDDVLEILVLLEDRLDASCDVVVLLADDVGIEEVAGGGQGIDGGIEAKGGDGTVEDGLGVEMAEGGRRGGIGQIVRRDIDGLDGGDGTVLGGGDALLELSHLGSEGRLIADGGRHSSKKGGDFTSRLGETIDVVDEKQDVVMGDVAEVFCHRQPGEGDAHTHAGGLVHLAEDEGGVLEDARFLHLVVEIVSFAGSLADAGKDGDAVLLGGDVVHQLLDQDGLADTGAAKEADLAAADIGAEKVNDLDAGFINFRLRGLILEFRGIVVDGMAFSALERAGIVDGLAEDVEHPSQDGIADGNLDGLSSVEDREVSPYAFRGTHGDAADGIVSDVLDHFQGQFLAVVQLDLQGDQKRRDGIFLETDVDDGSDCLDQGSIISHFLSS